MNALTVLFGGSLAGEAFEPVLGGKSAFSLALERAASFPGTEKVVLLGKEGVEYPRGPGFSVIAADWNVSLLLKTLSEEAEGFDLAYYAWADTPFLDAELAGRLAERHCRFAADYSCADGWPHGLAPELLAPGTAGVLYKIAGDSGAGRVQRDSVFTVLEKDINSFDIETEISTVDLRYHRLNLAADSRRNLLLLKRFVDEGILKQSPASGAAEKIIAEKPDLLRTLPNFFSVQVSPSCPSGGDEGSLGSCALCPYGERGRKAEHAGFMEPARFAALLDDIAAFAGDAVIDISLWGEPALHPDCERLIETALERPALALVVETSGKGWPDGAIGRIAEKDRAAGPRKNGMAGLSWIVSLNERDLPADGSGAAAFALELAAHFPKTAGGGDRVYVQAIRTKGAEDAIEKFYRAWKKTGLGIIIQKYNSFCGALPDRNAVDLSPVKRRPCWHVMRDFAVLLDGSVPFCVNACPQLWTTGGGVLGNVFTGSLEAVWESGGERYREHCRGQYGGICSNCDEYYTYTF
ncbi:MAG: spiro-SPASM protein [Treponema sp.]|jgi:spiro-SPASM protein|nr:spiro-SPASM protein [Treponema sp.]